MQKFFIVWTYIANYGKFECMAKDADEATEKLFRVYSKDFEKNATLYVFKGNPSLIVSPTGKLYQ